MSESNIAMCGVCGDTGMRRCPDCRGIQASCVNCVDGRVPCPCREPRHYVGRLPPVKDRGELWRQMRIKERQSYRKAAEERVAAAQRPSPLVPKTKRVHGNAKWQALDAPRAEVREIAFPPSMLRFCRHCKSSHPKSVATCPHTGNAID